MNPMTFQGHKFDLRIWAICTSLDPLRVYLMGSGIPKVSQWKYVKDKSQVKNMCVHVLFPGTAECYYSSDPLVRIIDPYPKSTTDAYWYNSVEPRGKEFWQKVVWTSVERKITELLLNAREGVLHIDHQLKRAGHRYKRIIFLQPDMVFDSRGNAYMVEVNTQGYMIGNLHKQFFELYKQQKAVFKLLGAHGYPEKGHYMDELRERARAFCRAQGCAAPMQREIHEMVHEDMHASYGWYRIFPQRGERHPHVASFRSTPQYANLLTPLDHLMQKWVEQGWEPAHTHDRNNSVIVGGGGGGGGGGGRRGRGN